MDKNVRQVLNICANFVKFSCFDLLNIVNKKPSKEQIFLFLDAVFIKCQITPFHDAFFLCRSSLCHFQSTQYPLRFGVSSRTDRGVHALHNTGTFDWISPIDITNLVQPLNSYLTEKNNQIRILRIHSISPQFHFRRHCLGRKYVYRLGFLNEQEFTSINMKIPFLRKNQRYLLRDITPATYNLFEKDYITYIEPPYDLDAFRKGIEIFQVNF